MRLNGAGCLAGVLLVLGASLFAPEASAGSSQTPLSLRAGICLTRAKELYAGGQIREAVSVIKEFVCPSTAGGSACAHPLLFFTLGNYYAALADSHKASDGDAEPDSLRSRAAENYRTALQADPAFAQAWLNLASVSHAMNRFGPAAQAFERGYALEQKPVHLYHASVCRFQEGNPKKALALFTTLMGRYPDQVSLAQKELLVHILFALDRHYQALPHIETLANTPWPAEVNGEGSTSGRRAKWQEILIHQYLRLEMDRKALAYASALTRSAPMEAKWWKALCHIHLKAGDQGLQQALSSLIIYGMLTPMAPEEALLAADLFLSLNIPARAVRGYQAVFSFMPEAKENQEVLKKLVQALAMAHDRESAVQWIDTALARPDLTPEEIRDLTRLKQQLLQLIKFYAAAGPLLRPAPSSQKE